MVKALGEGAKLVTGDVPGLDLVIYGAVLILVIRFAPRGVVGALPMRGTSWRAASFGRVRQRGRRPVAEALLAVENCRAASADCWRSNGASLSAPAARITALIGPNGAGKTTLFAMISGFLKPSAGRVRYGGQDITGEPPHRLARRGIARTFQIVQPFAGLTVRENIAVGAHLRHSARADAVTARGRGRRARSVLATCSTGRPIP